MRPALVHKISKYLKIVEGIPPGRRGADEEGTAMRSVILRAVGVATLWAGLGANAGADVMFQGLGNLPDGRPFNTVAGVSAAGSVVVGTSVTFPAIGVTVTEAVRWTAAGGAVGLGSLPGDSSSTVAGVSADGSVVV